MRFEGGPCQKNMALKGEAAGKKIMGVKGGGAPNKPFQVLQ